MKDKVYVLRVRLSWAKGVWREIAIRGDQTLEDFHRGILDAFEWFKDDTYRFYMSDEQNDSTDLYEPERPERDTKSTSIGSFDLEEDHDFVYFFSSGEQNLFRIRVMSIEDTESGAEYPDIVDENGESPDQDQAFRE